MRQLTHTGIISREIGNHLHQRLLDGDPTATSDLANVFLIPLCLRLKRAFPRIKEETWIYDAAVNALLLNYALNPKRFNPEKSGLFSYLFMSARGDLLNFLKQEGERKKREYGFESVELTVDNRNIMESLQSSRSKGPLEILEHREAIRLIESLIENPQDRDILELMVAGERRTAVFAQVLGLQDLSLGEQKKIVKQHKDRLKKRLERFGVKLGEKNTRKGNLP